MKKLEATNNFEFIPHEILGDISNYLSFRFNFISF